MEGHDKYFPEAFTPPVGFIRSIPSEKAGEYREKYKALGPFYRKEYDLDICTLYRQMDDLRSRYKNFGGQTFEKYVEQIKNGVALFLKQQDLDADFYLNHFYYVLNHNDSAYLAYLGLFLALSDPLRIIPILEYQYNQFYNDEAGSNAAENFLNELEFSACNFIRTNRFPEDYFAKHDKIMNWVFAKRDLRRYEDLMNNRFANLIDVLNKFIPKNIPKEVLTKVNIDRKSNDYVKVFVVEDMREKLFNDLENYFDKKNHSALKEILSGNAPDLLKIIFLGQANQLVDVFRIYAEDKNVNADKRTVAKWICNHFTYYYESMEHPEFFDNDATENMIYGQRPPTKDKRISLTGLKNARLTYYRKKAV